MLVFAAQIVSIFSVFLLGLGYLKATPNVVSARLCFLLTVCVVCYLLSTMSLAYIEEPYRLQFGGWTPLLYLGGSAIPGVFMFYCYYLFEDEATPSRVLLVLFIVGLALAQVPVWLPSFSSLLPQLVGESLSSFLLRTAPNLIQVVFAALALYWVAKGWSEDLVETRRVWRSVVLSLQAVVIFVVLLMENYVLVVAQEHYASVRSAIHYGISVVSFAALLMLFRFDYAPVEEALAKEGEVAEELEPDLSMAVETLDRLLKQQKVYREHGLTIAKLAAKMEMPEYRLRALINRHMGYRNFNALLHEYRIEDACHMLRQKQQKPLPILTIALTVGYQSITPFNNAFRQLKGVTPTTYRKTEQSC
ncbi:MAG: helix-turn-helix domain-containing protein [Pseudohongiellaceae bacterium]|nr:helix-turn-helix domain-containing protein [Pseudohongiellaceae bacterium]